MKFVIWRVKHGTEEHPRWNVSLRSIMETEELAILNEATFSALLPDVPLDQVPIAPETGLIEIQGRMT